MLAEHQLTPHRELTGDWSAESGYQATLSLFGSALPTALLVANDQMALGALRALHQAGLQIPAEVSVVGYDDTAESAWYQPPLTTVRQDIKQLGERSVDWLVQTLNEEQSPALMRPFATRLIIRETTAAPPQQRINAQAIASKHQHPADKTKGDR